MTVLYFVTADNKMLEYCLLFLVVIGGEGIKIEKEVELTELREWHGWYLLGGIQLSEGKVKMMNKIELFSTLREEKEYSVEIILMDRHELQIEVSQHCFVQNRIDESRAVMNKLQKQKGGNYVVQSEMQITQEYGQFMFVVMRDCKHSLVKQQFQKGNLHFQVNILNNKSHIPQAQHKRQLASLLSVLVLAYLIRSISKRLRYEGYDSVAFLIFIFLLLQLLAMLTNEIMLICRIIKGNHFFTLDIAKVFFHSLSQAVLLYTFYNVLLGWTIRTELLLLFKYMQQKILLFLIIFASQTTIFLYNSDLMYYLWAKSVSGTIKVLAISIFIVLILLRAKGADIKAIKLYTCMLLILVINAVSMPLFSLLIQRLTFYTHKIEIQTLQISLSTFSSIFLYKSFIGPSSIYYKNCLKNKSFMD